MRRFRCATTYRPTRSRRCRSSRTTTTSSAAIPTPASGQATQRRSASTRSAAGGIEVSVAGKRYGKGSSREHSPAAEKLAGIRLVIAESFERIYRQNADNIGLFTSTDFGLIERIQAARRFRSTNSWRAAMRWRRQSCAAAACCASASSTCATSRPVRGRDGGRPRTLFEKIVARHALATEVTDRAPARRATAPSCGPTGASSTSTTPAWPRTCCTRPSADPLALHDPASIVVFEDHTSYVERKPGARARRPGAQRAAHGRGAARRSSAGYGLRTHRTLTEDEAAADDGSNVAGISHAMMAEHYALPGQLVVGTDSHTPHSGALGCVAFGVGTTDMANAFVTGAVRLTVPQSLRIELDGACRAGVTAKDIVLHLLALPCIRARRRRRQGVRVLRRRDRRARPPTSAPRSPT